MTVTGTAATTYPLAASSTADGLMLADTVRDPDLVAAPGRNQEQVSAAPVRRSLITTRGVGYVALGFAVAAVWLMLLLAMNFSAIVVALGFLIALAIVK
jgi:hypothetical protein